MFNITKKNNIPRTNEKHQNIGISVHTCVCDDIDLLYLVEICNFYYLPLVYKIKLFVCAIDERSQLNSKMNVKIFFILSFVFSTFHLQNNTSSYICMSDMGGRSWYQMKSILGWRINIYELSDHNRKKK